MRRLLFVTAAVIGVLMIPAAPASAHPLGNFSVNQYAGLTLSPSRIDVLAIADIAEIPTLQEKPSVDTSRDGALSPAELSAFASAECARFAAGLTLSVSGERLSWTVTQPSFAVVPGAGGLSTSRLTCSLSAPASLSDTATVRVVNAYRSDRVGWREITATGSGVRLSSATVPADSVSGQLRSYPRDLLTSAPDVRSATITVGGAGSGSAAPAAALRTGSGTPSWLSAAQSRVESVLGGRLTPVVVGLAFVLALLLGAGHAALPGHGKTVMAAYFAGRRGRARDALAVGGTVTVAHTGGVLLVGLLLSTSTALAGERLLTWLSAASGALVVAVGLAMLASARRSRPHTREPHTHSHGALGDGPHGDGPHGHSHSHRSRGRSHGIGTHDDSHDHEGLDRRHGRTPHSHSHRHADAHGRAGGRFGLAGIGLAGGLVPSPSALVVLLGAIGLGRAGLGVLLVLAYGIGMAGTLTAVGLLLVVAQRRLAGLTVRDGRLGRAGKLVSRLSGRVSATAPTATAALVVVVGLGMGFRAVG
ncbi:High-affinity nickel-transporter [Actinoplanes sp. TBRC 11911]|uniref:HoxN/HupN/NixA family nickel/cobalt transporter n=1 Tax=Actinoplanes sp. TBRC 11911 TaxID=2729386 RepID=UPI00145C4E3F|nr:High-affinity nickel-transporter [Actinoplanes sp. TBRC 11911]NMO51767.1 High-affinity nickel-transporter [Actinoplanes sp. TBRC 11911]